MQWVHECMLAACMQRAWRAAVTKLGARLAAALHSSVAVRDALLELPHLEVHRCPTQHILRSSHQRKHCGWAGSAV